MPPCMAYKVTQLRSIFVGVREPTIIHMIKVDGCVESALSTLQFLLVEQETSGSAAAAASCGSSS